MNRLRRSFSLTRFHLAVLVCILLILLGVLISFFDVIEASMEEAALEINLGTMKRMMQIHNLVSQEHDSHCSFLDNPDLFPQVNALAQEASQEQQKDGQWQYDAKNHQLTYFVRTRNFFRSKFERKVVINLYCTKGMVVFHISPFNWCREKTLWGCAAW